MTPAPHAAEAANDADAQGTPPPLPEMLALRTQLVRYAQRRLHDPYLAEDAVHDVFEAVISGRARFAGRSALRSWLFGILRHKVIDLMRSRGAMDSLDAALDDHPESGPVCPQVRPDELAELRQRLRGALAGIQALPTRLRQAVELHVLLECPGEEVCRSLSISAAALHVRLHRARRMLAAAA